MLIAVALLVLPLCAVAQEAEHWTFTLTPYLWLPNVNGTLKYSPPPSGNGAPEVTTGPNNYLENLNAVFMLAGEARIPVLEAPRGETRTRPFSTATPNSGMNAIR